MACPVLLQPYSDSVFNSLPSIEQADLKSKELGVASVIASEIAALFLKHRVHTYLGVQLLHKHFCLSEDERLTDVGGAAIPWILDPSQELDSRLLPASWVFEADTYRPYEFQFVTPTNKLHSTPIPPAFLEAFNHILKAYKLQDILALRALKEDGKGPELEITQGRANVTFDYTHPTNGGKPIEATWAFEGDGLPMAQSYCVSYCSTRSSGHHNATHATYR